MRLLILLVVLLAVGCQNQKPEHFATQRFRDSLRIARDTTDYSPPTEYMEYGELTINGTISLRSRLKDLYEVLGKPDSIYATTDYCVTTFAKDTAYYAHFDETIAEVSKDSADVSSIDFRNGKARLVHPDFVLDRNTTLESLRKYFPKAVDKASPIQTDMGDAIWIALNTDTEPTDFQWLLIFQKGKLVRIDLNTPC